MAGTRTPCEVPADLPVGCPTPGKGLAAVPDTRQPLGAQPIHQEEHFSPHPLSHQRLAWKCLTNEGLQVAQPGCIPATPAFPALIPPVHTAEDAAATGMIHCWMQAALQTTSCSLPTPSGQVALADLLHSSPGAERMEGKPVPMASVTSSLSPGSPWQHRPFWAGTALLARVERDQQAPAVH